MTSTSSNSELPLLDFSVSQNWWNRSKTEFAKTPLNPVFSLPKPLEEQNWLIPGRFMIGAYPSCSSGNAASSSAIMRSLLDNGINTFVCLNVEYGSGSRYPAYADETMAKCFGIPNIKSYKPEFDRAKNFVHLPITDMGIAANHLVLETSKNIAERILAGENVYIHCSGGHGRSGTIAAIVLCMLYSISPHGAFEYMQYTHDQRIRNKFGTRRFETLLVGADMGLRLHICPGQVPTPQATNQRNQVRAIMLRYRKNNNTQEKISNPITCFALPHAAAATKTN